MGEKEKTDIMKKLCDLPEDKKQFILGYAAGVVSATVERENDSRPKEDDRHDQH